MSREAMKLALAALGLVDGDIEWQERSMTRKVVLKAITALQAALAEQPAQQDPVAWRYTDARGHYRYRGFVADFDKEYPMLKPRPLYTSPPAQRTWVNATTWRGLTDEEIDGMVEVTDLSGAYYYDDLHAVARATEAKLREKNNGFA